MKKFFGRDKLKLTKGTSANSDLVTSIDDNSSQHGHHTPIPVHHPHLRSRDPPRPFRSSTDDHWEVVANHEDGPQLPNPHSTPNLFPQPPPPHPILPSRSSSLASLPPGASPPIPASIPIAPRSSSPFSASSHTNSTVGARSQRTERESIRKKVPPTGTGVATLSILRALEPHAETVHHTPDLSEDSHYPDHPTKTEKDKKDKKGFWDRGVIWDREKEREKDKVRDRERGKERGHDDEGGPVELTRMIGYLTATSSEDWALVLEVCDRASANELNAKEAVKALRREFKYAEPSAQLSAARLWAIMLRNASDIFLDQISSRKFVDTLEDVLTSSRTAPVVRERLMEVLAAAAYISSSRGKEREKDGFRSLWRRLKPSDKPEEGVPFDTEDAMFSPPVRPTSQYSLEAMSFASPYTPEPPSPPPVTDGPITTPHRRRSRTKQIIPLDEDIRRLFQECRIGQGNATLLSEALAFARPEDLSRKDIIREFYAKCRASQELIQTQVPWASAGAERSRLEKNQLEPARARSPQNTENTSPDGSPVEATVEEDLLDALLAANESLAEALRMYDDLERIAIEKATEERSRREVRLDRREFLNGDYYAQQQSYSSYGGSSRTPSPSPPASLKHFDIPSIYASQNHPLPPLPPNASPKFPPRDYPNAQLSSPQLLAPPPPAPNGPRSPAQVPPSRTPSPDRLIRPSRKNSSSDSDKGDYPIQLERLHIQEERPMKEEDDAKTPIRPSAKALGKRKNVEQREDSYDGNGYAHEHHREPYNREPLVESDSDDGSAPWQQPVQYVYDAAAERTAQRLRDGRVSILHVNDV